MKRFGFTLAEVLITLAIVGLIASLTLPGLNSNVNNRRVGPALAKAINNLENANRMILVENEIATLDETGEYFDLLQDSLNASREDENDQILFRGKDGIQYTFTSEAPIRVFNFQAGRKYSGSYYNVIIDINGDRNPNQGASDQFGVLIDTRGAVIPRGGNEASRYLGVMGLQPAAESCLRDRVLRGTLNCTSRIIDDGWEVRYTIIDSIEPGEVNGSVDR